MIVYRKGFALAVGMGYNEATGKEGEAPLKKMRRFIWYLAGRLFLLVVLLGVFTVTFYYAMNASNIHIVLKDGMAKRAQVIMMQEDSSELTKFFQSSYLQRDENLQLAIEGKSPYIYYTVRGIDHRLQMTWMWCWPWQTKATAEFIETVPGIDGRVRSADAEAARALYGDGYEVPPAWQGGKYSATLVKENNQWHIRNLSLIELVNED